MDHVLEYLKDNLGLTFDVRKHSDAASWPVFLERAAEYFLCSLDGVQFIVASVPGNPSLPELKRIFNQAARRAEIPVALANNSIDARQRKALVQQGIPFVVPGKQAYLPFLGFVAATAATKRSLGEHLSPSSQAALVAIIANKDIRNAADLREITHVTSSSVSRALDELAERNLITKSKNGREVTFSYNNEKNALLKSAMPYLSSPLVRKVFARRNAALDALPDAGDSALASRSMLNHPAVGQKAIARNTMKEFAFDEILEGELDNEKIVELQVWSYDPLVAGLGSIDNVSLALSLASEKDERLTSELNALFDEEDLWH